MILQATIFIFLHTPGQTLVVVGGGLYLPGYEEIKNSACVFQPKCVLLTGFLWLGLLQGIPGILGECPSVLIRPFAQTGAVTAVENCRLDPCGGVLSNTLPFAAGSWDLAALNSLLSLQLGRRTGRVGVG